jgi:pimeloyl-ACP methyl ester carboxylesterase
VAASRPLVEAGTAVARLLGRLGLQPGTDLRELGRAYSRLADPVARGAFLQTLRSVVDREGQLLSVLPRLDVARRHPALIVWGDRDPVVPLRQGRQVHELVPNTYFAVFKNAGHFPHRDDPDRFVRAIDEFLAREWRLRGDGIALRA